MRIRKSMILALIVLLVASTPVSAEIFIRYHSPFLHRDAANTLALRAVYLYVGIGTTSPGVALQLGEVGGGPKQLMIHGDGDALTLKQDVEGDDIFQSWYTAGGVRRGYFGYGQGLGDVLTLSNETGGGIAIVGIDEDDVGIEDGKYLILLNDPDTAIGKQKGLAFGRSDSYIVAGIEPHIPNGGGGHLDFYTAATDDSLSSAMRIDQDSNVGIGTAMTTLEDKFTVYDTTASVNVRVQSDGPDADAGVVLRTATAPYWTIYEDESDSQKFVIKDSVGGDRLTIDTLGNVGIDTLHLARATQGSKVKALTESSATSFVEVDVAQGDSTLGEITYKIHANDATNIQVIGGRLRYSAVNEAGTVACTIADVGTAIDNTPTGTLTNTFSCAEDSADKVMLKANAVSSLTQTTLDIYYRIDSPDTDTVTPVP